MSELTEIENYAIQQFIGYHEAQQGSTVIDLIESQGLSNKEWGNIKEDVQTFLSEFEINEIEEYFATPKVILE